VNDSVYAGKVKPIFKFLAETSKKYLTDILRLAQDDNSTQINTDLASSLFLTGSTAVLFLL
jgi:hypothetical protein